MLLLAIIWLIAPVLSATYYVDTDSIGGTASDSNNGTISYPWLTISKANSELTAGDTLYIRNGTYSNNATVQDNCISPANIGTSGNTINYSAYNSETVILSGKGLYNSTVVARALIIICGRDYINIDGITTQNPSGGRWFHLEDSSHIHFDDCIFEVISNTMSWRASQFERSDYVQFVNCSWDGSNMDWSGQEFDLLENEYSTHYLFLRCSFGKAAHNSFGEMPYTWTSDTFGVFIDCDVENNWHSGLGLRGNKVLVEGCDFKNGGSETNPYNPTDQGNDPQLYISTEESIYRQNTMYNDTGMYFYASSAMKNCENNWLYHNTIYNAKKHGSSESYVGTLVFSEAGAGYQLKDNFLINNIMWKAEDDQQIFVYAISNNLNPAGNEISYNIIGDPVNTSSIRWGANTNTLSWMEGNDSEWIAGTNSLSDPNFTSPDAAIPDFSLQSDSPAIDMGRNITLANGSGVSITTLVCDDVVWAFSGSYAPWYCIHDDISADVIYFQQSDNSWVERTVIGINYVTNTITLDSAASWDDNASIYYKKFNGSAPDIGAFESTGIIEYDNEIRSNNPTTVYNDVGYNGVGQIGADSLFKSWVWFDLSEYNSTDIISYANLSLHWYFVHSGRNKSSNVGIYYSNATVDTNYLTWNNSSNGVAWREPGGNWLDANWADNGSTPFASKLFPVTAADNANHTFNITTLVQSIVNSSRSNNGFFIISNETNTNYIAFSSFDNTTQSHCPTLNITLGSPSPPSITSWQNNDTSDSTLDINVDLDQQVKFNATGNQTITTWTWKEDGIDQSHNYNNITLNWSLPGLYIVNVTAGNVNGVSSAVQWNVTVDDTTAWADSDYIYRQYILFNDSNIYGTNTNFSALIIITDTDITNVTQADGGDIALFNASTQLPHELIDFNLTPGYLRVWVRVSELSDTNRLIHIYYGNSTKSNQWNTTNTWQDYSLVMHLNDDTVDISGSGNNGTGSGIANITGKIGNASQFSFGDYIQIIGLLSSPSSATVTAWINQTGVDIVGSEIISLGDNLAFRLQPNLKSFYHYSTGWYDIETTDDIEDDDWTYMAASFQPNDQKIIKNAGTQLAAETNADAINYVGNGANTQIGRHGDGSTNYDYEGDIDELRLTTLIRNADWVHTEYLNQNDPATFYTIGAEEQQDEPDTKFEYWNGTAWVEGPDEYYLWFSCYRGDTESPNAEQSSSQPSLRITNNGTESGIPQMKLNMSAPSGIEIFVDDDNTYAGAVELNATYQTVSTTLTTGSNVTLWAWCNFDYPETWEYMTYANVTEV